MAVCGLSICGFIALAACDSPSADGEAPPGSQASAAEGSTGRSEVASTRTDQPAVRESVIVDFATDSIYGPRGAPMSNVAK